MNIDPGRWKRSNCLIFALWLWFQNGTGTSYLIIRKSRHTWLPHVMWSPSIEQTYVVEYKPVDPAQGKWFRAFPVPAVFFEGRIRKGWGEEGMGTKIGGGRD